MKYLSRIGVVILLIIMFSAYITTGKTDGRVHIRIQVKGYTSGQAYLIGIHKNVKSVIDSALVDTEGNLSFQREAPFEAGAYTVLLPDSSGINILLDQDQDFSLTTTAYDLVGAMKVEGSLENELLNRDRQLQLQQEREWQTLLAQEQDLEQLQQRREAFVNARKNLLARLFKKHPNTLFAKMTRAEQSMLFLADQVPGGSAEAQRYFLRAHFWDAVDFSDARLLRTEVIFDKLYIYMHQLTFPQTDSIRQSVDQLMDKVQNYPPYYHFFAEWITDIYRPQQSPLNDPEALYIHMVETYLNQESTPWMDSMQVYAWKLRAEDRALRLVGSQAVDITGSDPEGATHNLLDSEAPYILLYIYSPECDHCIEATPGYVQFYYDNKAKGLEVFAISRWSEEDVWKDFIEQNEMNWINVRETEEMELYKKYYIEGVPEVYLLNPERKIIGKHLTLEDIIPLIQLDLQKRQSVSIN
jgi:peroxiredoxin